MRWGVGDGKTIKIFSDNWIPGFRPHLVTTLSPFPTDATVSCLMNEDARCWDGDLIRSLFPVDIAKEILQMPISRHGDADFTSWPHDKLGLYSVRSAYNLARSEAFFADQSNSGRGMASRLLESQKDWKGLWKINAPGKMKITLWRAAHECLATGFQLRRRHIPSTDGCVFCNRDDTVEHVFLFCPFAAQIWEEIKGKCAVKLGRNGFSTMRQWIFDFLKRGSSHANTLLAVTFWHIWEARNNTKNNNGTVHPQRVVIKILSYVDMILKHNTKTVDGQRGENTQAIPRWQPPPAGVWMINSDAAIFSSSRTMGVGALIRDNTGKCLVACSEMISDVVLPELAEALAIRRALGLAKEEGLQHIVMASDCLTVIRRIQTSGRDRSGVGCVIEDIKKLASTFVLCSFMHVNRLSNLAAHSLAQNAELSTCTVYRSVIPVISGTYFGMMLLNQ